MAILYPHFSASIFTYIFFARKKILLLTSDFAEDYETQAFLQLLIKEIRQEQPEAEIVQKKGWHPKQLMVSDASLYSSSLCRVS